LLKVNTINGNVVKTNKSLNLNYNEEAEFSSNPSIQWKNLNNTSIVCNSNPGVFDEDSLEDLHYFSVAFFQKKCTLLTKIESC
jgi:hypothetical protein